MLKKGDKIEIKIRGEVMEDETSPDNAILVGCRLMRPSKDVMYSTFVLPKNIFPVSP